MKLLEKIENIQGILKNGNNLFLKGSNVIDSNDYIIVAPEYSIFEKWDYIYIYKDYNIKLFNERTNNFDIEYEDSISIAPSYYNKDHFLLFRKTDRLIDEILALEVVRNFVLNKPHNYFLGTKFISVSGVSLTKRNKLACYMIENDNIALWEFSLPEGFQIFHNIIFVDNVLYLHAVTWDSRRLHITYGLDIETGKVLWQINDPNPAYYLNKQDNLVYGYAANLFYVINPLTGQIILKKDMSQYYDSGIDPNNVLVQDDRLWFISRRGENLKFGALDTHTGDMVFVQDYPLSNDAQMDKPVFLSNKLYLRDENNVLHIFE